MKKWDAVYYECQTDDGRIFGIRAGKLVQCKECKYFVHDSDCYGDCSNDGGAKGFVYTTDYCSRAERKDEYVTLHHEDIHFIDEDAERAFYESLAERTRSFTDEEWEFYKKVNREKMQKTNLNIYDLLNKKEE